VKIHGIFTCEIRYLPRKLSQKKTKRFCRFN